YILTEAKIIDKSIMLDAKMLPLIETALCRARHKAVYADIRTMCTRLGIVRPLAPRSTAEERTMIAEQYLNRSRLFRRLRNGPHGSYVELYASQLIKIGLNRQSTDPA